MNKNKVSQLGYGSICSATSQCSTALGLTCSTTGYLCNCPTSLAAGRCDCTESQYYSGGCGRFFFSYTGFCFIK